VALLGKKGLRKKTVQRTGYIRSSVTLGGMMMRFRITGLVIIAFLLAAVSGFAEELNVGVIDADYILNNSERVLSEKKGLKEKFDKLQADLDEKKKALEKSAKEFDAQKQLYSDEAKKQKIGELESEKEKLVNTFKEYQQDIEKKEKELIKKVFEEIKEISKKQGYSLVIEKNSGYVLYSEPELDITKKIIDLYDSPKTK
jgi:outer membrane protein